MSYLMDTLTQIGAAFRTQKGVLRRMDPVLDGYIDLAERLTGAPRFLLDAGAMRTCVELNLGRPKVTLDAMAHLRIPYPKLWVEWDDADRQRLRDKFPWEKLSYKELRPLPGRVGFLLEADEGGRRGTATWAWTTPNGTAVGGLNVPNIGAIQPYFDLDQRYHLPEREIEGLLKGNLATLWVDNPIQLAALFDIWRTAEHRTSAWGEHYFAALGNDGLVRALAAGDVVGEYIVLWCTMLMLTASRPLLTYNSVDLSRLNKHRVRKGEVPLLDHTRVSLRLAPVGATLRPVQPLGYLRKSPRVHLVSSYLARRGDKHWIVEPYWRGSGDVIHRQTHVRG
jgi:hypothetical protein